MSTRIFAENVNHRPEVPELPDIFGFDMDSSIEQLILELDAVDSELRAVYRELADNPDLADDRQARIGELRERRSTLAMELGLAVLARHRTAPVESAPIVETPIPVEASVESAPVSVDALEDWKKKVAESGRLGAPLSSPRVEVVDWRTTLEKLMRIAGAPRDPNATIAMLEEVEALDDASNAETIARWPTLSRRVQQLWLSLLVARARAGG